MPGEGFAAAPDCDGVRRSEARSVSVGRRIAGQHPSGINCGHGFPRSCPIGLRLTCCCTCCRSALARVPRHCAPHAAGRQEAWRCGDEEAASRGVGHHSEPGFDLHTRPGRERTPPRDPRRQRSFAWLSRYRRLNTIFERLKEHLIAFVAIAFISILSRRLKRLTTEELSA
jgi:hypothetical protein